MVKNYLLIALRNVWRNKGYTLINLLGLAIGIASSIIILLFVLDELSFDRHNEHFRDIYRICIRGKIQGNEMEAALSNAPMGATLKSDFPEVKEFTRLFTFDGDPIVRYEDKVFIEDNFYYADSTFFNVFTAPVVFVSFIMCPPIDDMPDFAPTANGIAVAPPTIRSPSTVASNSIVVRAVVIVISVLPSKSMVNDSAPPPSVSMSITKDSRAIIETTAA